MLRDEFMAWATRTEAFYARLWVSREPLMTDDGIIDGAALRLLSDSFIDEKNLLVVGDWAENAQDSKCYHEFFYSGREEANGALDILAQLSEAAIRCMAAVPSLARRLKIDSTSLPDNLVWEACWADVMVRIGLLNTHPVVRASSGRFRYSKRYGDTEMFSLGGQMVLITSPPPEQLRRLKKLARSDSRFEELRCELFRGSAYAIDWLLQEVENES